MDSVFDNFKLGMDYDYTNKKFNSFSNIKEPGFKIAAEFPLIDYGFAKIMVNDKKEVFYTFGKEFNSVLVTFGTKMSIKNEENRFKYDFSLNCEFI